MSLQSRPEATDLKAVGIAGRALEAEIRIFRDILSLHPRCFRVAALDRVMAGVAELAGGLKLEGASVWHRILNAELGQAVLRTAMKTSGKAGSDALVLMGDEQGGLEHFIRIFPSSPLIFVLGNDRNPGDLQGTLSKLISRGHPILPLRFESFERERERTISQMLDFARLPLKEFPWDRLKNGCLNPPDPLPSEVRL